MTHHWNIYFWHGWDWNYAQEIMDQFLDVQLVEPDDGHATHMKVYGSAEMVLATLLDFDLQVWFKPDQETVFITGHNNFGQR